MSESLLPITGKPDVVALEPQSSTDRVVLCRRLAFSARPARFRARAALLWQPVIASSAAATRMAVFSHSTVICPRCWSSPTYTIVIWGLLKLRLIDISGGSSRLS